MSTSLFEDQLEAILTTFESFQSWSQFDDLVDIPEDECQALVSRSIAAVHRISGPNSAYALDIQRIVKESPYLYRHMSSIVGVVQALKADINAGMLRTLVELAHGDVFADFIEMAEHLNDSGYKDAAAVIVGSTLESHLRGLCNKANIQVTTVDKNDKAWPKKADGLNADLAKASAYSGLDQKNVTAWLDLRNKAAHGRYDEYNTDQVSLLISGIGDFIARFPA